MLHITLQYSTYAEALSFKQSSFCQTQQKFARSLR